MPGETQKRKRPVAACQPCYSKKQKCDHQYPCSNCVRRRLPELCNYNFADNDNSQLKSKTSLPSTAERSPKRTAHGSQSPSGSEDGEWKDGRVSMSPMPSLDLDGSPTFGANLSTCLGYFEGSKSNLFSLMDKFDLINTNELEMENPGALPSAIVSDIQKCMDVFPQRAVVNCLIQHFLNEVNWMYEMIHPTLFLNKYEQWWRSAPGNNIESLDFGVLILRLCAYSAQFLPSPTHGSDMVVNIPVNTVRQHCEKLATRLWRLSEQSDGPKSLTCVQHLFYHACYVKNEGSMRDAWYVLGDSIRIMQDLGIHLEEPLRSQTPLNDLEKDMRRRAFWNLYIWDRFLSLVLDRSPCIPEEHYCSVDLPKMRFLPGASQNSNAPDVFTERIYQAKLSKLWYSIVPANKTESYDPSTAEELYERLCRDYVAQLPHAFSLQNPDLQWDQQVPMLARQRQTLRISVFRILCQLFQPLLHLTSEQIQAMPQYKRDLIGVHRDHLVNASVSLIESVSQLHELMGNTPARFFHLSFFTFEPAMLLAMYVMSTATSSKALFQAREQHGRNFLFQSPASPQSAWESSPRDALTSSQCRVHIEQALERLIMLQESSMIAKVGARKLREVLTKLDTLSSNDSDDEKSTREPTQTPPSTGRSRVKEESTHTRSRDQTITSSNINQNWFGVERNATRSAAHSRSHSRSQSRSRPQLSRMHSYASINSSLSVDTPPQQGHSYGREMSTYRPQHQHSHSFSHAMSIDPNLSPQPQWPMGMSPATFSPNRHCISPPIDGQAFGSTMSDLSAFDSGMGESVGSAHSSAHFNFDTGDMATQWPLYETNEEAEGLGVYMNGIPNQYVTEDKFTNDHMNRGLRSDSGVSGVTSPNMFDGQEVEAH